MQQPRRSPLQSQPEAEGGQEEPRPRGWRVAQRALKRRMRTPPLTTPEERVALFQQLFSDTNPHTKALGIKVLAVARGLASMRLGWRRELVGNPETGIL